MDVIPPKDKKLMRESCENSQGMQEQVEIPLLGFRACVRACVCACVRACAAYLAGVVMEILFLLVAGCFFGQAPAAVL